MRILEQLKALIKVNGGSVQGITTVSAAVKELTKLVGNPAPKQQYIPHKSYQAEAKAEN